MTIAGSGYDTPFKVTALRQDHQVATETAMIEYLEECRYEGKAPATLRTYRWALRRLVKGCPQLPVGPKEVRRVLADESLAWESRLGLRRDLSAFFSWAAREYGHSHPIQQLPRLKKRRTLPRVLTAEELQRLWDATETPRERALVALGLDNGLRIRETSALRRAAVDTRSCQVDGKTGPRRIPLSPQVHRLLMELGDGDHIWIGKRGPMTTWGVNQVYRRLFARAGIKGRKVGPHTLRHTFGTMYYRSGGNLRILQEIMGHQDLKTTMIYVHLAGRDVDADHAVHSPINSFDLAPMGGDGDGADPGIGQYGPRL